MPRHLHRDALGNARADEIADGGSTEVVEDTTRTSSFRTGRPKRYAEALDGPARAVKHARADDLELPLEILGDRFLLFSRYASRLSAKSNRL